MGLLLFLFSLLSRGASGLKNVLYDKKIKAPSRAPLPVISVGNVSLGGTGKTPVVMELLEYFIRKGTKPALVSRGYRGRWKKRGGTVSDGRSVHAGWLEAGDEPFMVALRVPAAGVFVGKHRLASCRKAAELGFEVAVLDDGFQHRKLHRDVDIVLIHRSKRTALREPLSSLRRADILLSEKGALPWPVQRIADGSPRPKVLDISFKALRFRRVADGRPVPGEELRGVRALAFCGIAGPERFFALLQSTGLSLSGRRAFPDHHAYSQSSLGKILRDCGRLRPGAVVTTEKDALKIKDHPDFLEKVAPLYLEIRAELDPAFFAEVEAVLREKEKAELK